MCILDKLIIQSHSARILAQVYQILIGTTTAIYKRLDAKKTVVSSSPEPATVREQSKVSKKKQDHFEAGQLGVKHS